MINIMKYYKSWFVVSLLLTVAAIVALSVYGLKPGIDFRGGTLTQIGFANSVPASTEVGETLKSAGFEGVQVQVLGEKSMVIRTAPQENEEHLKLVKTLTDKYEGVTEEQFTSIGPVIGQELKGQAAVQLILVSLGIILYIAYAFRKVTRPVSSWRFGIAAIVALVHDLLIVIGVFAILGHYRGVEVDSLFVTALLTVLGFSVHDTIVVFDRIRENLRVRAGQNLFEIINNSINQTLIRSLNTSLTVVFVLTALFLFGGISIHYFVLALLVGIVAGTYSSIFIASPLLYVWHNWEVSRKK